MAGRKERTEPFGASPSKRSLIYLFIHVSFEVGSRCIRFPSCCPSPWRSFERISQLCTGDSITANSPCRRPRQVDGILRFAGPGPDHEARAGPISDMHEPQPFPDCDQYMTALTTGNGSYRPQHPLPDSCGGVRYGQGSRRSTSLLAGAKLTFAGKPLDSDSEVHRSNADTGLGAGSVQRLRGGTLHSFAS
jgi:hypothetical protein